MCGCDCKLYCDCEYNSDLCCHMLSVVISSTPLILEIDVTMTMNIDLKMIVNVTDVQVKRYNVLKHMNLL